MQLLHVKAAAFPCATQGGGRGWQHEVGPHPLPNTDHIVVLFTLSKYTKKRDERANLRATEEGFELFFG